MSRRSATSHFAWAAFGWVALVSAACSSSLSPIQPGSGPYAVAVAPTVAGYVIDHGGACLTGATVEIVSGPAAGRRVAQTTPCNVWGETNGFVLDNLTAGVELTIRAVAPGYQVAERTVSPGGTRIEIVLSEAIQNR